MSYSFLRVAHNTDTNVHVIHLFPLETLKKGGRPALSEAVIDEIELALDDIAGLADDNPGLSHAVICSDAPVFAFGADLASIVQHVRKNERAELMHYLRKACRFAHRLHGHLHPRVHTMALVQGAAMGGGFEVALACETLIAERGVKFALPEIAFGSFPALAYSFLYRLMGQTGAARMLVSGTTYKSDELQALGVIEHLAEPKMGWEVANALIEQQKKAGPAFMALKKVKNTLHPITLQELEDVAEIWVDFMMNLPEHHLQMMEQLVRAQEERIKRVG